MKKTFRMSLLLIISALLLAACGGDKEEESKALSEDKVLVGVTGGPHEQIFEVVKEVAAKDGLEVELKVFSDYIMPNKALAEGQLDVNSYQHKPFMDKFNEDHGTDLVAAVPTILSAIGVYSNEIDDIADVPENAKIGIPNDPSNGSRALVLFEEAGLIKLDDAKRDNATPLDVVENEKNVSFVELDAAQLPLMLDEVNLAVINGNFAASHGLNPSTDSIYTESIDSPYVNYIVVRKENENDAVIEKLRKAYHSDEVKQFIEEEFKGSYLPKW